jgi:hypothetical protein
VSTSYRSKLGSNLLGGGGQCGTNVSLVATKTTLS